MESDEEINCKALMAKGEKINIKPSRKHMVVNSAALSPTTSYFNIISQPSINLARPSPKLIILDLNGTLCHRKKTKGKNFNTILRPFVTEFIDHLLKDFLVMVWSTSRPENVDDMVNLIFGDRKEKLFAIWARDKFGFTKEEYERHTEAIKDLEIVWKALNSQPENHSKLILDPTNTILIDDSDYKTRLQPYNAIHPLEFNRESLRKGGDSELKNIIEYLEG